MQLDLIELQKLVDDKYIKKITDPEGSPLCIYDYTWKTSIDKLWNSFTTKCRGLILDNHGNIIARPFDKFFNLDQCPETRLINLPAEIPEIMDKLDGSMIIAFYDTYKSRWRTITRGSWESPQAQWAEKWINAQNLPPSDLTYMFELTAPWNRLVVLYREEKMTLLCIRRREGEELSRIEQEKIAAEHNWSIVRCWTGPITNLKMDGKFNNEEGFVVRYSNGFRVKMKYDSYCSLHKTMTCLSIHGIWESLVAGDTLDLSELPDEFLNWYNEVRGNIQTLYNVLASQVEAVFAATNIEDRTRKEIALGWKSQPGTIKAALFMKIDGKDYSCPLWKAIKPIGNRTFCIDEGSAGCKDKFHGS